MAAFADWGKAVARLKGVLRHGGCTVEEADDVVQDACLKLACYQRTHEVANPDAFLLRTARNLAIDASRLKRNHGHVVLLEDAEAEAPLPGQADSSTEDIVLDGERTARLFLQVKSLPELQRQVFEAYLYQGMTYQQIAVSRGMSIRAVRRHLSNATALLMRRMEGW